MIESLSTTHLEASPQVVGCDRPVDQIRHNVDNDEPPHLDDDMIPEEALKTIVLIDQNEYRGGTTGHIQEESMPCICKYEPGDDRENACGEDCINRALFIECSEADCPSGEYCLNRRFQRKEYAPIQVFKTEKKGWGLRTKADLKAGSFVIEYCGEILPRSVFLKRIRQYHETGAKHFYFMSLKSDEIIDASQKGNIARFMNHSCNPNCVLQKWVVETQVRIGIFTLKDVKAGSELTFDYKFERYGDKAQACFCEEPNCKGIIGGKKSELKGLDVSNDVDDYDDEEDFGNGNEAAVPRKKRAGSSPESDYEEDMDDQESNGARVPRIKSLQSEEDVQKCVKKMLYTTKAGRMKRLLAKIESTSALLQRKFLQYHGLVVLKSCLLHFKSDNDITMTVLRILKSLPITTRNTIVDTKIETILNLFIETNSQSELSGFAQEVITAWSTLPLVYRIPKRKQADGPTEAASLAASASGTGDSRDSSAKRIRESGTSYSSPSSHSDYVSLTDRLYGPYTGRYSTPVERRVAWQPGSTSSRSPASPPIRSYSSPRTYSAQHQREYPRSEPSRTASSYESGESRRVLPSMWRKAYDSSGVPYYYHVETGHTQWEFPDSDAAPKSSSRSDYGSSEYSSGRYSSSRRGQDERDLRSGDEPRQSAVSRPHSQHHDRPPPSSSLSLSLSSSSSSYDQRYRHDQPPSSSHYSRPAAHEARSTTPTDQDAPVATPRYNGSLAESDPIDTTSYYSSVGTLDGPSLQTELAEDKPGQDGTQRDDFHELRIEISQYVVRYLSKHKEAIRPDIFKKFARKLSHEILEKETRKKHPPKNMTDDLKKKMKGFLKDEVARILKRQDDL
ncbi:uncharacterized protein BJ171DRAFT_485101 [Polychytrium aggregatum]|uniref:uncharacterized protein n=1 Tax=Polychytrium aggregatum TaxID=110093 RepID=UPI0022FF0522|nr:uncharacterized protein BJ171DRAFT_485101 [Polychytrium aggregatum]KAI9209813.1 hypothetical protein BJ171DRAFT_485101 [Polychytrium aggregatum]